MNEDISQHRPACEICGRPATKAELQRIDVTPGPLECLARNIPPPTYRQFAPGKVFYFCEDHQLEDVHNQPEDSSNQRATFFVRLTGRPGGKLFLFLWAAALLCASATAAPIKVVATGDSLTVGYGPFLQAALDARRPGRFEVSRVARGGTDAREYAGLIENPQCNCGLTDMVAEVLALDPDIIVFMLGTNDSSFVGGVGYYEELMPTFLDQFEASGAQVIIAAPPPILPTTPYYAFAEGNLAGQIDPLIRGWAIERSLPLVDLRAHDWTGLYHDSVHMTYPEGRRVMAGIFADRVVRAGRFYRRRARARIVFGWPEFSSASQSYQAVVVPEPAGLLLFGFSVPFATFIQRRRSWFESC